MMNLFYEPLPDFIPAGGSCCKILTDFRDWLKFSDMLKDEEITPEDKLDLMRCWFVDPPEVITRELYEGLREFCRAAEIEPGEPQEQDDMEHLAEPPSFDWRMDAACVIADFRRYYGIDLMRVEYLHWWEFLFLVRELPDDSKTYGRIGIRKTDLSKIKDADRRRAVARAQLRIRIPFEMDDYAIGDAFSGAISL